MFFETVLSSQPAFAADVLVKTTLLLMSLLLVDLCLRKGSAAMRHRVWAMVFAGLLLLPILSYVIPEYRIAILPADWFAQELVRASNPLNPEAVQISPAPTFDNSELSPNTAKPPIPPDWQLEETQLGVSGSATSAFEPTLEPKSMPTPIPNETKQTSTSNGWYLTIKILGLIWFIGCLIAISPLILGSWRVRLLHRKSPQVLDQEPLRTLGELCRRLGILPSRPFRDLTVRLPVSCE